jgi:hypothetical protein
MKNRSRRFGTRIPYRPKIHPPHHNRRGDPQGSSGTLVVARGCSNRGAHRRPRVSRPRCPPPLGGVPTAVHVVVTATPITNRPWVSHQPNPTTAHGFSDRGARRRPSVSRATPRPPNLPSPSPQPNQRSRNATSSSGLRHSQNRSSQSGTDPAGKSSKRRTQTEPDASDCHSIRSPGSHPAASRTCAGIVTRPPAMTVLTARTTPNCLWGITRPDYRNLPRSASRENTCQ